MTSRCGNPHFPPSGPTHWLFQGPPAESKFIRVCLGTLLALISGPPATAADRPNIIIRYIDDLARGDVGAFGCPDPGTENIDRLAGMGIRFDYGYTHNAPCSPSRTALMMGGYTQSFGKYGFSCGVPIPKKTCQTNCDTRAGGQGR